MSFLDLPIKAFRLRRAFPLHYSINLTVTHRFALTAKEAKDHGEGGNLIGSSLTGNALLVDDVITAGTAIRESMALLEANNAKLSAVFIALNRKEKGKGELSAIQEVERDYQCKVLSIIDFDDLMQFMKMKPIISNICRQCVLIVKAMVCNSSLEK